MATLPLGQESLADALRRLADRTNCTGEAYFRGLVRGLAEVLSVRWVYLSRLHPTVPNRVQVVAGWSDNAPAENIEYDLAGTPCAEVMTGVTCFHASGVRDIFPLDAMLGDLGVESYAGTPLRAADGQPQGLLVIMHDGPMDPSRHHPRAIMELVSGRAAAELERSRVEEQLRRSEEQNRFLSESTPALLWTATPDGRLDYLSPRAAEYCGVPLQTLLGYGYVAHMHPDDIAHKLELWNLARENGTPFEAEYRLRGVDGSYRWQLTRALPKREADGSIARWYGSVVDVDDRKRAEDALRDADHRKDEFLAMLAHELRNPLAPICHALDVQARTSDQEIWTEMRQTMGRQVQHLVRLVDDLLDVSRLTMGRITLRRESVDVSHIMADALDTCRAVLEAKQHRVTTRFPSEPLVIDGDRIRLAQILTNILNNAAKFTEPGGHIELDVSADVDAIEIRVRDNGSGISGERLGRIFDLFSQSDPSPDREQGGLGVGLTLAKSLVEMHGGTLTASSAGPRRGSEFCILLPRVMRNVPISSAERTPAPSAHLGARRILVVDDHMDATRALRRLLHVMGHDVTIAHDGQSGLEIAEHLRPDVILLDIGLPRMDGYAVARRLRSKPALSSTRIIALTGYGAADVRENARKAGFDHHLVKPVDADELEAAISSGPE
jgi:two-component system CheB/CheR fusion protein